FGAWIYRGDAVDCAFDWTDQRIEERALAAEDASHVEADRPGDEDQQHHVEGDLKKPRNAHARSTLRSVRGAARRRRGTRARAGLPARSARTRATSIYHSAPIPRSHART